MTGKKKLVIFDCDGTLVDSDYSIAYSYALTLQDMGYSQLYDTEKCLQLFHGLSIGAVIEFLNSRIANLNIEQFADLAQEHLAKIYASSGGLFLFPDVKDTIEALKKAQIAICVASNGLNNIVMQALEVTNLIQYFARDQIFTYEMVKEGKPAPDLFLLALDKMQAKAEDTLIVEDSIAGVMAANAAKIDVAVINRAGDFSQFSNLKALINITDMRKILAYFSYSA